MRILTRYILGELLSHALIGCALFTFVLFMPYLSHVLEMVVRNSSSLTSAVEIFLFMLPNLLRVTIPMSVLVGVLLGFSRLAADSEIIAMRASGLGIWYYVRVASLLAIAGTVVGLANSLYLAPRANQAILSMERSLGASQASYEIQPRVFYEDFKNFVLYVQDVRSGSGAANWRQVFMADVTDPNTPIITTASSATVVTDSSQVLLMRLRDGARHETKAQKSDQYNISTYATADLPLSLAAQNGVRIGRLDTAIYALPLHELMVEASKPGKDARRYQIELQSRFSFPAACLVLMLVGVPLGISSRRGGKSSGFVFTVLLVFVYYFLSSTGMALAKQNKLPVFASVWSANLLFASVGLFLLWQMATGSNRFGSLLSWTGRAPKSADPGQSAVRVSWFTRLMNRFEPRTNRGRSRNAFPRILDEYVIREFLFLFLLVLAAFVMLMLVFTFFDLIGDIIRNHIHLVTVGEYLLNLAPSMIYQITPLAVLIATLVTFGILNRNSEIIAMKATGISLYRLVIPTITIAAIISVSLFLFDDFYLPQANRRQEALRSVIKGRPAQTFLHPEQKWIFGQTHPGGRGRIFYYQFFDPDRNEFANLSVFEFDPATFELSRRIFASRVYWDEETEAWRFQNGWTREIKGAETTGYHEFSQTNFADVAEDPSYFKKENLQSQEMNFSQLDAYIRDLRQSGFDTKRLSVALWHKLAYPLAAVLMAMLSVPFALSMGRRGSLAAVAIAITVALSYWVLDNAFGAMGNVNYLPALVAAWSADLLFGLTGGYLLLRTPT